MGLVLLMFVALPQDYINHIMEGEYPEAIRYCDDMISKGKKTYEWTLEKGDIYLSRLLDFQNAVQTYQYAMDTYKKKDGWLYYRLALALELAENYLDAAKMYEIVATQYRKTPLDSFSLNGVERCFKKNYQDYVAKIDGYHITRLELDERLSGTSPFANKDENVVLDQMIIERLLYANAQAEGVMEMPIFKANMENNRNTAILEELRIIEIMKKSKPSEKDMKKYYNSHKNEYLLREEIRGKEIVVKSESLATALLDSLNKDVISFDTLAKIHSTASTARSAGNMGVIYRGFKPAPVEKALFAAEANDLLGVVTFDDTLYGIYLVTQHKSERYREFEEVKTSIEAAITTEMVKKNDEKFMKGLKKKAKTEIRFEEYPGDSVRAETADVVIAVINERPITMNDMDRRNSLEPFGARDLTDKEQYTLLLNTMIEENLKLEVAERKKYYLNDGYITKIKDSIKRELESGLYQKIVIENARADSAEMIQYYQERKEDFKIPETVRCLEMVLDDKQKAKDLRAHLLANPDSFDSLAREHSLSATGKRGGDTGPIRRGIRSAEFDNVVFKMKVGTLSKVFKTGDNYTFVRLQEHNPMTYHPFEEVKASIESNILRTKQREIANSYLTKIKEEADIEIFLGPDEPPPEEIPEDVEE